MKLPQTTAPQTNHLSGTNAPSPPASLKALNLRPGQLLNIQVTQQQGSQINFRLANPTNPQSTQTYQAETLNPLKVGQNYNVKVIATQPKLQLQLQAPPTNPSQPIPQLYRQLLPNMQPLAQALHQLSQPELLKQLPAPLQQQIQKLLDSLLKPHKSPNGNQLKQATINSGLFLENRLSQTHAHPSQDLKAQLLKLQAALNQSPSDHSLKAKSLIDKMLNRITLNQIQSIENPWLITDLPLSPNPYFKQINLQIRTHTDPAIQSWQITLNLDTEQGLWQNKLHLNAKQELRLQIWIESPALRQKVMAAQTQLQQKLTEAGLQLKQIHYLTTPPKEDKQAPPTLIDIKI